VTYATREPIAGRNTFHANRQFAEGVRAKASELEAIFAEVSVDAKKLQARLEALGFGRDSLGQWFYKEQLIPFTPSKSSSTVSPKEL